MGIGTYNYHTHSRSHKQTTSLAIILSLFLFLAFPPSPQTQAEPAGHAFSDPFSHICLSVARNLNFVLLCTKIGRYLVGLRGS